MGLGKVKSGMVKTSRKLRIEMVSGCWQILAADKLSCGSSCVKVWKS